MSTSNDILKRRVDEVYRHLQAASDAAHRLAEVEHNADTENLRDGCAILEAAAFALGNDLDCCG